MGDQGLIARRRIALVAAIVVALLLGAGAALGADAAPLGSDETASGVAFDGPVETAAADPRVGETGGGPNSDAAADLDSHTIFVRHTLSLTDDPGAVRVATSVQIPSRVTELRVVLPDTTDAGIETDGFERADDTSRSGSVWVWDGATSDASLSYEMNANVTGERTDGYRFVGTDDWALVPTPGPLVSEWGYVGGTPVARDLQVETDGQGVASESMAYLWPYEEHVREAEGQRFRLIVPEAAEMASSPESVFATFEESAARLRAGARDDEVFAVAAPTDGVSWGPGGLARGAASLWVRDTRSTESVDDAWAHEYVHTRQAYYAESDARWVVEATAEYYAALFGLDRGAVDFESFRSQLERGGRDPHASAVLADPASWSDDTDYRKGALVAGEIDRQIRLASGGEASLMTVFRALNDSPDPITSRAFLDAVESAAAAGGDEAAAGTVRETAERLTTTDAATDGWRREDHVEAFGTLPTLVEYRLVPPAESGVRATGEYRNKTISTPGNEARLVRGERLNLAVDVSNAGGAAGSYEVRLSVDGEAVETKSGSVGPDAEERVWVGPTFADTGSYDVRVAGETLDVEVLEPANVYVLGATASRDVASVGESIVVTATVMSDAEIPASSDVEFQVNGESIGTESVRADGEATVEREVTLNETGQVTVTVVGPAGRASTTVTVEGAGATEGDGPIGSGNHGVEVPGFGATSAVAALLAVVWLLGYRRER
ncbi:PGF-CTERM sorting domain-containing protein [Halorubrum sp. SD683]|uniref:PGF-CTERM sorting domain-containing protein n=1 Tax=Halorubrum sp. SD683 TaxID=1855873 RepID=UPI000A2D6C55|nr:PGF-CTERM sorting domain-containing protein [Halorubrum sp. SD683]OTF00408.1 hypothetical protein B9G49_07660 [Halorubrum sp. SD683]